MSATIASCTLHGRVRAVWSRGFRPRLARAREEGVEARVRLVHAVLHAGAEVAVAVRLRGVDQPDGEPGLALVLIEGVEPPRSGPVWGA